MKLRTWLAALLCGAAGLALFLGLTIRFIPDAAIEAAIGRLLAREELTFHAERIRTLLPCGLRLERAAIGDERGPLLAADRITIRLLLLPLLAGRVRLGLEGSIGSGTISAEAAPFGEEPEFTLHGRDLRLEAFPFFKTATGADVSGALAVDGRLRGRGARAHGEFRLESLVAAVSHADIGGLTLPGATYRSIRAMLRIAGGRVAIESFACEGESLYARLRGDFPVSTPLASAPLNLTIDLLPNPGLLESQRTVFLLLMKYQVSPGNYQVPVRGTLARPSVS